MTRILLSGAGGAMGRVIARAVAERQDCAVAAGIDPAANLDLGFPVFPDAKACDVPADVIIDFSHPSALEGLLAMALRRKLPAVIATTGLSAEQAENIREAAKSIPLFFTANMSLGVNLMLELGKIAARVLGSDFDIEIVEKHHNRKIDAPSGTALMLADALSDAADAPMQYVYDRHSQRKKRQKNEIGLHAVRGGTIVGEHDIIFAGQGEVLTLSHAASSREIFATGALRAALFLSGRPAGLYSMADMI